MNAKHKKISMGAAAASLTTVALAMGVAPGVGVAAPVATGNLSTRPAPVDATPYSLSCSSMTLKITFSPALTNSPASGNVTMTLKNVATGCTTAAPAAGGPPVSVASVKGSGKLTLPNASCSSLVGGGFLGGTMTLKIERTTGTAKLSSGPSLVTFGSFSGGVDPATGGLTLGLPGSVVGLPAVQSTGSFSGVDGGRSDALSITDGTFATDQQQCAAHGGLKSLTFGGGTMSLG